LNAKRYLNFLVRRMTYNRITYKIYEKTLWDQVKDGEKPAHIAVIVDGNRRWANKRSASTSVGHKTGADKVEELLRWCLNLGVRTITRYAFSTENFQKRSKEETGDILGLFNERLKRIAVDKDIHTERVKVRAIGRLYLLPKETQKLIRSAEEATKNYDDHYLNLAVAYGGRAEIIDAMKTIATEIKEGKLQVEEINEEVVEDHLYTAHLPKSEPDLVIRTSGEERLSGFLLWQAAYSELCFLDVYWPDFRRIDLLRAVRTFQKRERRYGA
jgi:tritrans,polycis-undecaprenyl-diphosphate synthase [geranylgeranyl-diphosphate specific]